MEHPVDLPSVRLQESNAESTTQTMTCAEEPKSCDQHMHEDSEHIDAEIEKSEVLDNGSLQYGCPHYRRRRRIRAPCCNEIFYCHHCHNEAKLCKIQIKNDINVDQKERHTIPHHEVQQVICTLCGTEQEVQQMCANCGVCMAKYFCGTCKLFDDDISKRQFHCDGCGICRLIYAYLLNYVQQQQQQHTQSRRKQGMGEVKCRQIIPLTQDNPGAERLLPTRPPASACVRVR